MLNYDCWVCTKLTPTACRYITGCRYMLLPFGDSQRCADMARNHAIFVAAALPCVQFISVFTRIQMIPVYISPFRRMLVFISFVEARTARMLMTLIMYYYGSLQRNFEYGTTRQLGCNSVRSMVGSGGVHTRINAKILSGRTSMHLESGS
jgi:hypothetical protein